MKKILLNELYDDYIIVEKLERHGGHQFYKMKCKKCGHIKVCSDSNLLKQNNNHSALNCKLDFYKCFIGKKIGDYVCLNVLNENKENKLVLKCSVCEKIKKINLHALKKDYKHSILLCKEKYFENFIGKQIGDFKVLEIKEKKNSDAKFICECVKCKTQIIVTSKSLLKNKFIHGHICFKFLKDDNYKEIFARRFYDMKQRCNNENNNNYIHYGSRNVKLKYDFVIDFYYDFIEEFKKHSEIYGLKNSSFDRINVNGNYEKNNLRVTTQEIQNINCTDRIFFILKKDKQIVICDSAMHFGKHFNINGRAIGNLVRKQSKSSFGWKLIKIIKDVNKDNLSEIIKHEGVTTNLIISL